MGNIISGYSDPLAARLTADLLFLFQLSPQFLFFISKFGSLLKFLRCNGCFLLSPDFLQFLFINASLKVR